MRWKRANGAPAKTCKTPMTYALALHGGAGTIQPGADETPYHAALREAAQVGEAILAKGGSAIDAVTASVVALEDCILFNAGRGSVYTADATFEMDASLMEGAHLTAGAVAGVSRIRNPVLLAKAIMDDGRCVLMAGEGAERFAATQGFVFMPPEYFASEKRLEQLRRAQAEGVVVLDHSGAAAEPIAPDTKRGTVGAVALDQHGNLASATSTGGMTNKRPGRVGDTPLIGAGCYAENATAAISATGSGEYFIRAVVGHDVAAQMRYGGKTLAAAADATIHERMGALGGDGGVVAVDRDGNIAMPFNTTGMYRAWVRSGEVIHTAIFK